MAPTELQRIELANLKGSLQHSGASRIGTTGGESDAIAQARREERERCAAVVGTRRAYELTDGAQALARAMDAIRALK